MGGDGASDVRGESGSNEEYRVGGNSGVIEEHRDTLADEDGVRVEHLVKGE